MSACPYTIWYAVKCGYIHFYISRVCAIHKMKESVLLNVAVSCARIVNRLAISTTLSPFSSHIWGYPIFSFSCHSILGICSIQAKCVACVYLNANKTLKCVFSCEVRWIDNWYSFFTFFRCHWSCVHSYICSFVAHMDIKDSTIGRYLIYLFIIKIIFLIIFLSFSHIAISCCIIKAIERFIYAFR